MLYYICFCSSLHKNVCVNIFIYVDINENKMINRVYVEIVGWYSTQHEMDREDYLRKCSNMKCQRVRILVMFYLQILSSIYHVISSIAFFCILQHLKKYLFSVFDYLVLLHLIKYFRS